MRTLFALILGALLAGCGTIAPSARSTESVAAAGAAWVDAYNSRDPVRITAMYERDAVLWGTTAKTVATTPEQIWDYFKAAPTRPDARVVILQQSIRVAGDMAFSSGSYTFSDVRDGTRQDNPARFTLVFRLRDGQWRILHHHSSRLPT